MTCQNSTCNVHTCVDAFLWLLEPLVRALWRARRRFLVLPIPPRAGPTSARRWLQRFDQLKPSLECFVLWPSTVLCASEGGSRTLRAEIGRAVASARCPQQLQCWAKASGCHGAQRRLVLACVAPKCRVFQCTPCLPRGAADVHLGPGCWCSSAF